MRKQERPVPADPLPPALREDLVVLSDVLPVNYYVPGHEGTWQRLDGGPDDPPNAKKERP